MKDFLDYDDSDKELFLQDVHDEVQHQLYIVEYCLEAFEQLLGDYIIFQACLCTIWFEFVAPPDVRFIAC